ncbi:proline-rich protein 2-like [Calypte anna]|uniref:proline-rich protein 2-like n=1 Tax=Calypte anna TaxID=9244 RepID=UPI0011C37C1F|nr:proline-rich protein 2-like [Calypte anna]
MPARSLRASRGTAALLSPPPGGPHLPLPPGTRRPPCPTPHTRRGLPSPPTPEASHHPIPPPPPGPTHRTPPGRPGSPAASPRQSPGMPRGRARSRTAVVAERVGVTAGRGTGEKGTLTPRSAAQPRPPPPASPHLRHVSPHPAPPPPPAYLPPASPAPGPPRCSSPIGGENSPRPAPPPVRRSDWFLPQSLKRVPASKPAPTALPFVERSYWLAGLQEVLADWPPLGRPLK